MNRTRAGPRSSSPSARAAETGWVLLQDTTLPGYTAIPTKIMEGYTQMASEALEQAAAQLSAAGATGGEGGAPFTHVVLQVGAWSFRLAPIRWSH